MFGKIFVAQRRSKKGKYYKCIVFAPENEYLKEIVVSFDELTMRRLAEMEGCTLSEYVVDDEDDEDDEDNEDDEDREKETRQS